MRNGQSRIAGLEVEHGVVHREIAIDDEVAVGDTGRRTDGISGGNARVAGHAEIAIDRAETRDGAVRRRIDVPTDRDTCSATVAADYQRAAADINPAGKIGRTIKHLRIA
ncbi:hypothetical protein D3C87_1523580 [compost metagenome]